MKAEGCWLCGKCAGRRAALRVDASLAYRATSLDILRMFGAFKQVFTSVKAGAVEAGAKAYLNGKIQDFGRVTNLQIDTAQKTLLIEAELKGESSPVQVRVGQYELSGDGENSFVVARGFEASREWLATVLNSYVANRPFRIPGAVRNLL